MPAISAPVFFGLDPDEGCPCGGLALGPPWWPGPSRALEETPRRSRERRVCNHRGRPKRGGQRGRRKAGEGGGERLGSKVPRDPPSRTLGSSVHTVWDSGLSQCHMLAVVESPYCPGGTHGTRSKKDTRRCQQQGPMQSRDRWKPVSGFRGYYPDNPPSPSAAKARRHLRQPCQQGCRHRFRSALEFETFRPCLGPKRAISGPYSAVPLPGPLSFDRGPVGVTDVTRVSRWCCASSRSPTCHVGRPLPWDYRGG
ncbi:hypothetical protein QBC39DRAFT_36057 [Podospora conica]|nr:hypothetical protein QBC39DRAFT_36057 [Schizothecium conicum]